MYVNKSGSIFFMSNGKKHLNLKWLMIKFYEMCHSSQENAHSKTSPIDCDGVHVLRCQTPGNIFNTSMDKESYAQ